MCANGVGNSIQETIQGCIQALASSINELVTAADDSVASRKAKVLRCFAEQDVAYLSPASKNSMAEAVDKLSDGSRSGDHTPEIRKVVEDLKLKLREA